MPISKQQVKLETRVDKIVVNNSNIINNGRLKSTEPSVRGSTTDISGASQARLPSGGQSRWENVPSQEEMEKVTSQCSRRCFGFVPVLGKTGKPLMPCHPARARQLVTKGKAKYMYKIGTIIYLQLLEREVGATQRVVIGIDPGSKREAFTVKSYQHTYVNVLSNAVDHVKDAVEVKRNMRKSRRYRNTPCRKNRQNRARGGIPPSTKSRWQLKLRMVEILNKLYPIEVYVVEDVAALTKKWQKRWNSSFSPLEIGKEWFYEELMEMGELILKSGFETSNIRKSLELKKSSSKLEEKFSAHNVDSWVLANCGAGGHTKPDNENIIKIDPIQFVRRRLHKLQPSSGGIRRREGGTISLGYKKGTIVRHAKHGIVYIGGNIEKNGKVGISLHNLGNGKRICQNAKLKDLTILAYNSWKSYNV